MSIQSQLDTIYAGLGIEVHHIGADGTVTSSRRPLYEVAADIRRNWKNVYFGAEPYLDAMSQLGTVEDNFHYDSGKDIVRYFLANASSWRGEDAKRVKAELKEMVK